MSVRNSLLAILGEKATHGYDLKASFESRTAGVWPLNVGQVYTTLRRLERDGLVEAVEIESGPKQTWQLTGTGRASLEGWFEAPVVDDPPARDELAIKVLIAVASDSVDVVALLDKQRKATLERLQEYTRLKRGADADRELPWLLMLDALVLKAEAELRWLELCEQRLAARVG